MVTRTLGTSSWAGPSTLRIPYISRLPGLPLSNAYSVTSPPSSHGLANHLTYHPLITGSERARGSGTQLTISYRELYVSARWQPTLNDPLLLPISRVKRFGYQQETSECACPVESSVPDTLVPLPSRSRSTQSLTISNYHLNTEFIPPFMCHSSSRITLPFLSPQISIRLRNPPFRWSWMTERPTR